MTISLIIAPIIGAFIGWGTNYIAIRMLFRPIKPIKLPLINFYIQGVVPKRQAQLAVKIGEAVERDLLSGEQIIKQLETEIAKGNLVECISPLIKARVLAKIPAFIPISIKSMVGNIVEDIVCREAPHLIAETLDKMSGKLEESLNIGKMVEERVKNFSLPEMERLILDVSAKELRHIEVLGAVLGFIIGLVQDIVLLLV